MALFSSPPASLCILRLSAIGDACNASAMVQAIQRQWPTTKITWVMGKAEAQLLGDLPGVRVIPFDKKNWGLKATPSCGSNCMAKDSMRCYICKPH